MQIGPHERLRVGKRLVQSPAEKLLWMYRTMVTIRRFAARAWGEARRLGGGGGVLHLAAGQEAVCTGVCANLTERDHIGSGHRGHGHCIAKGVDPRLMMAELVGKATGTNKGKGGSMHIADLSKGMLGANGVVAASVPTAVGAALTAKIRKTDDVAVAFFGDGASNQGVVHESMNLASIWKLPVIFVCENNLYAEATPVEYSTSCKNIADRAAGYSMPGVVVDGMDVFDVYDKAAVAIGRARSSLGPTLLECKTYRYYGHFSGDPGGYRSPEEEVRWRQRDPIVFFRQRVVRDKRLTGIQLDAIEREVDQLLDEAAEFARKSPLPPPEEVYSDMYADYPLQALKRGAGMLV